MKHYIERIDTSPEPFLCQHCGHDIWFEEPRMKIANPNGEYVEGYGHTTVFVQDGHYRKCANCGFIEGGNPKVISLDGDPASTED